MQSWNGASQWQLSHALPEIVACSARTPILVLPVFLLFPLDCQDAMNGQPPPG
jgi:hypothetical protein